MQTLFLPNLAEGANIQQDLVYTFKRAIQERSSSYQNLAQATDESARPRQQDSKCKLKAFKLLPKPCTGTRKRQDHVYIIQPCKPLGLAKALLRERMSQQDRVYIVQRHANQELLGSCKPCRGSGRVSKTTFTSFKHANFWTHAKPC